MSNIVAKAPAPGIIQGVLPPVLLAGLFALLPLILRGKLSDDVGFDILICTRSRLV